jgi:hypothetical protein
VSRRNEETTDRREVLLCNPVHQQGYRLTNQHVWNVLHISITLDFHRLHDQFWSTCGFTYVQLISLRLLRSIRMLRERHSWHSLKSGKARQDWCSGGTPFYPVVKRLLSLLATDLANIPTKEDVECINTTTRPTLQR